MRAKHLLLLPFISLPCFAQWQLDNDASRLSFLTTKNAQVTETHHFTSLNGNLSDAGQLTVNIDLSSVETHIPIRNERMQKFLFDTVTFPQATVSATLPAKVLDMPVGSSQAIDLPAQLDLHGTKAPVTFALQVTRTQRGFTATTTKPTVINAQAFELQGGVKKLQELAKLSSITSAVPVTFTVNFAE